MGRSGWPTCDYMDYRGWGGESTYVAHPLVEGVWIGGALPLDDLSAEIDAVVVFDDVFIPSHRMEISASLAGRWSRGHGLHKGWLWNAGYPATIGTALTPVSLGIADTMLDLVSDKVQKRTVPRPRRAISMLSM